MLSKNIGDKVGQGKNLTADHAVGKMWIFMWTKVRNHELAQLLNITGPINKKS